MSDPTLRSARRSFPEPAGPPSRRGALVSAAVLAVLIFCSPPSRLAATTLGLQYEPEPLVTPPALLVFFDPEPGACAHDAGCLWETPHNPLPAALAMPLRPHLPAAAARILLPGQNRWLLAATDARLRPEALVPQPPLVGQPPRIHSLPFDLVARADRLHIASMFLIGVTLLLAGSALGLIVRSPAEPAAPQAEPWIPERKVLPRLVASPVAPVHLRQHSV